MKCYLLFILIILVSCQTNKESTDVEISSVDMDISTVFSIKCDEFNKHFDSTEVRTRHVNQTDSVKSLLLQLSQLELDNDKRDPDTRARIIIRNATTIDQYVLTCSLLSTRISIIQCLMS